MRESWMDIYAFVIYLSMHVLAYTINQTLD